MDCVNVLASTLVTLKRARRLEFAIVIVNDVEGEVELDGYRKNSGGLSLLFRHRWDRPEWRAKQLKCRLAHFLHFVARADWFTTFPVWAQLTMRYTNIWLLTLFSQTTAVIFYPWALLL